MKDTAHEATDRKIAELERRIIKLFSEAQRPLQEEIEAFFKRFEVEDNKKREQVDAEEITREQYIQWRLLRIARGVEFAELKNSVAEKIADTNQEVAEQISASMPEVYAINYNQEREDAGAEVLAALTASAVILLNRPRLDRRFE